MRLKGGYVREFSPPTKERRMGPPNPPDMLWFALPSAHALRLYRHQGTPGMPVQNQPLTSPVRLAGEHLCARSTLRRIPAVTCRPPL